MIAGGAMLLSAADALLRVFWEDYRPIGVAIRLALGLAVLALLCRRIFGKRTPRGLAQPAR
jgi:ABC-type enterobactin transport system permease subunit